MRCSDVLPRLSDLLDGRVPAAEAQEIEDHLATCSSCSATLARLRQVSELARASYSMVPRAADASYFDGVARRLSARLADEAPPGVIPTAPIPSGDLFAYDPDSAPKL